ncbi:MAG: hypothetical protein ABI885_20855 [Gammaproteobacteria bacterium]
MKIRTALYVFLLVLVAVFVMANWALLVQPVEISLLIATARVPGAMLGVVLVATVLLIDWAVHALNRREWDRQRRVADVEIARLRAEATDMGASRQKETHTLIERESARIRAQLDEIQRRDAVARVAPLPADGPRKLSNN